MIFRNKLYKLLSSFNLQEAIKLSNEIYIHKKQDNSVSLLSLEEEKLWNELELLIDEYKRYN